MSLKLIFTLFCYWAIGIMIILFIEKVIELIDILMSCESIKNLYDKIMSNMYFEFQESVNHLLFDLVVEIIIRLLFDK